MSSVICFKSLQSGTCQTESRDSTSERIYVKFLRPSGSVIFRDVALADRSKALKSNTAYEMVHYVNPAKEEVFSNLSEIAIRQTAECVLFSLPQIGINLPTSTTVFYQQQSDVYQPITLSSLIESYIVSVTQKQSIALKKRNTMIPMFVRGIEQHYAVKNSTVLFPGFARTLKIQYDVLDTDPTILNLQKKLVLDTLDNIVLFNYFDIVQQETIVTQTIDQSTGDSEVVLTEVVV